MNHNSLLAVTIICALVTLSSAAQEAKQLAKEPKTKLEAFEAQTGSVLIKGFGEIGSVSGMGSSVVVDCREFTDATTSRKEYGITIEVKETGRFERKDTAFIDYDEIDSLLKGIDYISKIDKSVTLLPDFEAAYRTKAEGRTTSCHVQQRYWWKDSSRCTQWPHRRSLSFLIARSVSQIQKLDRAGED